MKRATPSPLGRGRIVARYLRADRDVVIAVGGDEPLEHPLGKARHGGEEAAVARLRRQFGEALGEPGAIRWPDHSEPHRRPVPQMMDDVRTLRRCHRTRGWYSASSSSAYRASTFRRLSLSVGVSMPLSVVKSSLTSRNFSGRS